MRLFENSTGDSGGVLYKSAYHRYFEGYTENVIYNKRGRKRIQRIYTEDYYKQDRTQIRWILNKALYALLYLFSAGSFAVSALADFTGNHMWYITLPEAFCVFFMARTGLTLVNYVFAPRKMTVGKYHEISSGLMKRIRMEIPFILLVLVGMAAYGLVNHCLEEATLISCMTGIIVSALFTGILIGIEKKLSYITEENIQRDKTTGVQIY